jgi:three-Cys-motif partner protein
MAVKFDNIGRWSEIKLEIIEKYALSYSKILSSRKNPSFHHVYIDAFAGSGTHISRTTGEAVRGSPLRALDISPPFKEYYFIDTDGDKVLELKKKTFERPEVHILEGDCNIKLLTEVFPKVKREDYKRGLCLLDPYGLDLDWEVISMAGNLGSIDMILNFPVMDINRNVLWINPYEVDISGIERMNAFWGDDSWKEISYRQQPDLFGEVRFLKENNNAVSQAFKEHLQKDAGFKHVSQPLPMRNSKGAVIYYLYFASQQQIAKDIIEDIFNKYRV